MNDGAVINLARTPTQNLNIRANTSPTTVGSVEMMLTGSQFHTQMADSTPYSLFGDSGAGTYFPWTPNPGSYTLESTPFTESNGSGLPGTSLTINFTVTLAPPTITGVSQTANGHIIIAGQADPLSLISIKAAPDLMSTFMTIDSVTADANGAFQYEDANAANDTEQFYRASY